MPSFKPKPVKKIKVSKKNSTTLDGKHKEFINEFAKDENDTIPTLKSEKIELKQQLLNPVTDLTIEIKMDIQDRINEIDETIKLTKSKKKDYFLDNAKFIFDYFENKKNISKGSVSTFKNKAIDNFFKIKNEETNKAENKTNNIVQKYLSNIDDAFLDVNAFVSPTDICQYCFKGELIPLEDEGILICNICSRNIPYLIENEKPSYKEPPKEICFYAYKRINHFKEIIAQFQGKETTQIPLDVIENIKQQIKKERIDLSQITNHKTKEILKKLGYNKYYEHIPFIKDKLGIKPPIMSPELEETLFNLFMELQAPYSKFCPDDRVNFLNYYYTAYKLCELLGENQYLAHFPMLKDREKRIDQDTIWKKICEELDWEFIPTI
jgi:hypothetical protein